MTSFCGSIDFLAPEMVNMFPRNHLERGYGKEIDIWAIGVISFALMSGELPFSESDHDEDLKIMRHIVSCGVAFGSTWANKSLVGKDPSRMVI
jgi:serine/threonine protein kinase